MEDADTEVGGGLSSIYGEVSRAVSQRGADEMLPEQQEPMLPDTNDERREQRRTGYDTNGDVEYELGGEVKRKKSWKQGLMDVLGMVFVCSKEWRAYRNITTEHGAEKSWATKQGFYIHWLTCIGCVTNLFALYANPVSALFTHFLDVFLPLVYLFCSSSLGWYLWLSPMQKELEKETSFNSLWVLLMFFLHVLVCIIMLIGVPGFGAEGIVGTASKPYHFIQVINIVLWCVILLWSLLLWRRLRELGER